jgi:hypothetical protein
MKITDIILNVASFVLISISMAFAIHTNQTLSKLAGSYTEPALLLGTITTTVALWQFSNWRAPAVSLLLLTAFSVFHYEIIHNLSAVLFFTTSLISIIRAKRLKGWALGYVAAAIGGLHSLLLFEILAISSILAFHIHYFILRSSVSRWHFDQ